MGTSQHAFQQVKSILGKLDRSIDAARERRLSNGIVPVAPGPILAATPIGIAAATAAAALPADPGRSGFGRAKPLRG